MAEEAANANTQRTPCLKRYGINIKIGTWNVAGNSNTSDDLARWFSQHTTSKPTSLEALAETHRSNLVHEQRPQSFLADDIDLYVLGLQEVTELSAIAEYFNEDRHANSDYIARWQKALEVVVPQEYTLVSKTSLVGLLMLVYASPKVACHISDVSSREVGTGLLRVLGNKGAIATRLILDESIGLVLSTAILQAALKTTIWSVAAQTFAKF